MAMFELLLCLTAVSSQCKTQEGRRFVDGSSVARFNGDWVEAGDASLTGAPDLMTNVKDALGESISEHSITEYQGELSSH